MSAANDVLAKVTRERARVLGPAMFLGTSCFIALAKPLGIPSVGYAYAATFVLLAALGACSFALARGRIADRYIHYASVLCWWCPFASTVVAAYATEQLGLKVLLVVLIASAGVLLHTGLVIASVGAANALVIPLLLSDTRISDGMFVATMVAATTFALLIHVLMRKALLRAETHRLAAAATAETLARQLAELERSHEERRRLHEQLSHAQRIEVAGTLAAGLAHDMNNVLASITTFAELVAANPSAPNARDDIKQVIAQAARGAALTRGLLAFSRRGQYRKQVLAVNDLAQNAVQLLSRTLPKTIEIRTVLDASDARVDGDPAQLTQVLMNFGVNAADAMAGQGTLELETTAVELDAGAASVLGLAPGRYVRLLVTDTGCGMDEATRLRVFEPFYTTKPIGKGTGLGLSLVWGIVQSHGGAVDVESQRGHGSTFRVFLPICDAPVATRAAPSRTQSPPIARVTVLVVDDEAPVRTGTARLMKREGFDVLLAANGAEALEQLTAHADAIGLVILDMGMPVMSGSECFARLREVSDVPVLLATGYAVEAEAQAMVARGASLIEKPFLSKDLVALVKRILDERARSATLPAHANVAVLSAPSMETGARQSTSR